MFLLCVFHFQELLFPLRNLAQAALSTSQGLGTSSDGLSGSGETIRQIGVPDAGSSSATIQTSPSALSGLFAHMTWLMCAMTTL